MLFLGLAAAGLVVLAACSVKVFFAVRRLGRQIERTRRGLEPRHAALRDELRGLRRARE
jgi:hypothetical protein